jgi:hypothetical protein
MSGSPFHNSVFLVAGLLGFAFGFLLIRAIKRRSLQRQQKKEIPFSRLGDHLLRDVGIDPRSTRPFSCEPPKAPGKPTCESQWWPEGPRTPGRRIDCFEKLGLSLLSAGTCAARSADVNNGHGDTQAPRQTALPVQALRNTRRSRRLRVDEARAVFLFPRCIFAFDSQRRGMRLSWR